MIEQLTIDKLIAYGFTSGDVESFRQWGNFELMFHKAIKGSIGLQILKRKYILGKMAFGNCTSKMSTWLISAK